ncbi:polysaccharide biosynthesis/export family protein [Mesoterricola silvestris]|uniref:Uncharacterized protein n=1 Tax=Mesoterricola silvestris TaxID=2927979 RepID=A0AA48K7F2_9BACT|nr:SLBB domain-containing protein [Mesoterricola silvestris]BDU71090.1 hypothetical protein METEAL_02640 [Mesoterricola silvestris]
MIRPRFTGIFFTALALVAQEPGATDFQSLRQAASAAQAGGALAADATPRAASAPRSPQTPEAARQAQTEQDRIQAEIKAAKAREKGPKRFAEDLFATRQASSTGTEGGIADDYVLGIGDQVQLSAFGSANFEVPGTVDGRGELVIPKVGSIKVAGMSLAKARASVQAKVGQQFSRTTVDLAVVKLREVRVFVLGEVYRPGGYLVPSLSSLVNVLSLAGGPTASGSYRQIRVMRGGKAVHQVDLYPLRAEGLGNMNFGLQSGDTIFVPLAFNQVTLEGAFTRVVAATGDLQPRKVKTRLDKEIANLKEQIAAEEFRLGPKGSVNRMHAEALLGEREGLDEFDPAKEQDQEKIKASMVRDRELEQEQEALKASAASASLPMGPVAATATGFQEPTLAERALIEERLVQLRKRLERISVQARGDQRTPKVTEQEALADNVSMENNGLPGWLVRWNSDGKAPSMQFEMLPGETVEQALRFAGGLALQAFDDSLVLRRVGKGGVLDATDVPLAGAGRTELRRGDVLSALTSRELREKLVTVSGWARVPGSFSRTEGLRVGELLRRESQVLPDTYLHRGEIVRTLADERTTYLAFDLAKALAGDPEHNVLLQDRDQIELYRISDLRLPQTVQVLGPVSRPGTFPFHEGMRASDLLFQTGVLLNQADRLVAELAHTREGKPSEVRKLDLTKLLSSETSSPVQLADEAINPLLRPQDQINVYAKPDYRPHRSVTLRGQVVRPGVYVLDSNRTSLREILNRAGGLTSEAMPQGSIFLRPLTTTTNVDSFSLEAQRSNTKAPALGSVNNILDRLNETKRQPTTGNLLKTPILHGLGTGSLDRLVVNVPAILAGDTRLDVDLQDGDEIIVPRRTETAYVIGETASPFMAYHVASGFKVRDMLKVAGGLTRNADDSNIRLLKADGRILDRSVLGEYVEPGDAVLVPQRVRRDTTWQENIQAITPLALILNAIK